MERQKVTLLAPTALAFPSVRLLTGSLKWSMT